MIINQLTLNPVANYQQISQQLQQQLPSLLAPITAVEASAPAQAIQSQPFSAEQQAQTLHLNTLVDYSPWLAHFAHQWQAQLHQQYPAVTSQIPQQPPTHWYPESTAHWMLGISLHYVGYLYYQQHHTLINIAQTLSQQWRAFWTTYHQERQQDSTPHNTLTVLVNAAEHFQHLWLEYWLHLGELSTTLPSNPQEKNAHPSIDNN